MTRDWSKYRVPKFSPSGVQLELMHKFKEELLDWLEEGQAESKVDAPEPESAAPQTDATETTTASPTRSERKAARKRKTQL